MITKHTPSYWLDIPLIEGEKAKPQDGGIVIIGSGLSGVSTAYWLLENGMEDITLVDFAPATAASFRNCGHILYGTVESMHALNALHGEEIAKAIWGFSIQICHEVRDTIARLGLDADYHQDGYLVTAIDETENQEIIDSIDLLARMGFDDSVYVSRAELARMGFKNVYGARHEKGSAQAHPVKFRNGLLENALQRGLRYYSGVEVTAVEETNEGVELTTRQHGALRFDAAVIATNAYSPLLSRFFAERKLVDPFRGQIITSHPLRQHQFPVRYPHSFDHGYIYALVTPDNRLMIGGWRNHTPGGEVGTYDIMPNPLVEDGLKSFVQEYYDIKETMSWEYSWAGLMAASRTGFPFIGPTSSQRIFTVAGYTGHGFSWAHGSARLLADIMVGNSIPAVARYFNPRQQ